MGGSLRRRDLSTEEWRPSEAMTDESDLHEVKVRFGGSVERTPETTTTKFSTCTTALRQRIRECTTA
ncbi:hypothetical protein CIB48_g2079 [Xylaria polymorpha]|nr:hypothetical protein CIB48_g2079 [Xylaria polymorpha]